MSAGSILPGALLGALNSNTEPKVLLLYSPILARLKSYGPQAVAVTAIQRQGGDSRSP